MLQPGELRKIEKCWNEQLYSCSLYSSSSYMPLFMRLASTFLIQLHISMHTKILIRCDPLAFDFTQSENQWYLVIKEECWQNLAIKLAHASPQKHCILCYPGLLHLQMNVNPALRFTSRFNTTGSTGAMWIKLLPKETTANNIVWVRDIDRVIYHR